MGHPSGCGGADLLAVMRDGFADGFGVGVRLLALGVGALRGGERGDTLGDLLGASCGPVCESGCGCNPKVPNSRHVRLRDSSFNSSFFTFTGMNLSVLSAGGSNNLRLPIARCERKRCYNEWIWDAKLDSTQH